MSHLVLPVQVQIPRTKSDRLNKIPRYVSNSFKFLFYHLTKSILVEEADTKEEVEIEVGTTIMEVDIEADMMVDMDVVGTADEVAVDTEIIVVGHTAGITGLDLNNQLTLPSNWSHCSARFDTDNTVTPAVSPTQKLKSRKFESSIFGVL